jgi:protein-disulfide isomerase
MTRLALIALTVALATGPARAQDDPLASRSKGQAAAPVTVYEMSDFQCPFCKRHAEETMPVLEREYIATGKVRWVFVNFPLTSIHPNAVPAAEFAMCAARQNRFWDAHHILFRTQGTWAPLRDPGPFLMSLVDSLRLARPAMTGCLARGETRAEVRSDAEGAIRAGARSTPTFYIEGGLMAGSQPVDVFRQVLDSIYAAKTGRRGGVRGPPPG